MLHQNHESPAPAGTDEALDALLLGLADDSALLRHEICYVLGQLRKARAIPVLVNLLEVDRDVMVRHEAAEALGAIADPAVLEKEQLDSVLLVLKVSNAALTHPRLHTHIHAHVSSLPCCCVAYSHFILSSVRNICLMLLQKFLKPAKLPSTAFSGASKMQSSVSLSL